MVRAIGLDPLPARRWSARISALLGSIRMSGVPGWPRSNKTVITPHANGHPRHPSACRADDSKGSKSTVETGQAT